MKRLITASLLINCGLFAATSTWQGNSTSMVLPANWSGGTPVNGSDLIFPLNTSGYITTGLDNNIGTLSVGNITIQDAYTITTGSPFTIPNSTNTLIYSNSATGSPSVISLLSIALSTGATLTVTGTNPTSAANINQITSQITGTGNLTLSTGMLNVSNASNTYTGTTNIGGGASLGVSGLGTTSQLNFTTGLGTLTALGDFSASTPVVITALGAIDTDVNTVTLSGLISGNILNKEGSGTLILSNATGNTYTGATNVNDGTLQAGVSQQVFGSNSSVVVGSTGILDINSQAVTIGLLSGQVGSEVTLGSGTLSITSGSSFPFYGVISGTSGNLILAATTPAPTLSLMSSNTYTGTTTIQGGSSLNTLDFGATSTYIFSSGGGILTLGSDISSSTAAFQINAPAAIATNTFDVTSSGAITGTGQSLSKLGPGTLTLTGANTNAGQIVIEGGVLNLTPTSLGSATSIQFNTFGGTFQAGAAFTSPQITIPITLNTQGTFDTNGFGVTINAAVSGGDNLVKIGTGTLTLSGANSYTGLTVLQEGTFNVIPNFASSQIVFSGSSGTGIFQAAGNFTTTFPSVVFMSSGTIDTNNFSITSSDVIAGNTTSTFTKAGLGTLTLSGANIYTGPTQVNAGTLSAGIATSGSTGAFGNGSAVTVATGATLAANNFANTTGALSNSGTVSSGATLTTSSYSQASGGSLILDISTSGASVYGNIVSSGAISLSGITSLNVTNSGGYSPTSGTHLVLLQGSSLTGTFTSTSADGSLGTTSFTYPSNQVLINFGSISCANGTWIATASGNWQNSTPSLNWSANCPAPGIDNLPSENDTATFNDVASGAIIVTMADNAGINPVSVTLQALNFGATTTVYTLEPFGVSTITLNANNGTPGLPTPTITVTTLAVANPTIDVPITLGANSALSVASGSTLTFGSTAAISGTFGLTNSGAGTVILGGPSNYSGATLISAGRLQAGIATSGSTGAFGNGSAVTIADGGTLDLHGFDNTIQSLSGSGATTAAVTLGSGTLTITNGSGNEFDGIISGTGGLTLGTGTLTLGGANTYSGPTTVNGGALTAGIATSGNSGAFGNGSVVNIAGSAELSLVTFNNTIGSLTGSGSVDLGSGTLTITNGGGNTFSGSVSGSGGLSLTSGDFTLSGSNNYTGATIVNGGTLTAGIGTSGSTGPFGNGSAVTVATGATLAFANFETTVGSINNAGTVSSGAQVSTSSYSQTSGGSLILDISNSLGTTYGNILSSGAISLSGITSLSVTNSGNYSPTPGSHLILLQGSSLTGTFSSAVADPSLGNITFTYPTNQVWINFISSSCNVGTWNDTGTTGYWGSVVPNNWSNSCAAPGSSTNNVDAVAILGDVVSGSSTVTITMQDNGGAAQDLTLEEINFTALTTAYTIEQFGGSGTITLDSSSAFSPQVSVAAGSQTIDTPIILNKSSIFSVSPGATLTLGSSGAISGGSSVSLTKNGTGTVILQGLSSYTGPTIINAGTLQAGIDNSGVNGPFGYNSDVIIANGGTLALADFDVVIGSLSGIAGSAVDMGSGSLTIYNGNGNTFAGVISGIGGDLEINTGSLTLSGLNTFGQLNVDTTATAIAGIATSGNAGAFGNNTTTLYVNSSATIDFGKFANTVGLISTASGSTLSSGATVTASSYSQGSGSFLILDITDAALYGNLDVSGAIDVGTSGLLSVTNSGGYQPIAGSSLVLLQGVSLTGTFSSAIADPSLGNVSFTYPANQVWINFLGASCNVGTWNSIDSTGFWGSTAPNNWSASCAAPGSSTNNMNAVAIFDDVAGGSSTMTITMQDNGGIAQDLILEELNFFASATDYTIAQFNNSGTITLDTTQPIQPTINVTAGTPTIDVPIILTQATTISVGTGSTLTMGSASVISSGSSLTLSKEGSGTLILQGPSTYTGGLVIDAGTVQAGIATTSSNGAFGNNVEVELSSGGVLALQGFNNTIESLQGAVNSSITLGSGILTISDGGSNTFSGVISDSSLGGGLTLSTDTFTLSGLNTYTGPTTINGSAILIAGVGTTGNAGAFGNGSSVSIPDTGVLALNGYNNTIGSLSGGSGSYIDNNGGTLTISNGAGTYAGFIYGGGGVTLTGGAETFSGLNAYSGATTVNGGTLTAGIGTTGSNGPFGYNSAVTVAAGATLAFVNNATIVGSISNSGTVSSGAQITTSSYTQTSLGTLTLDISNSTGPVYGNISSVGAINLTGALMGGSLNVTNGGGYSPLTGSQLVLLSGTSLTGTFTSTSATAFPGATFSYTATEVLIHFLSSCANGTWIGTTSGSWGSADVPNNWSATCAAPGSANNVSENDTATFNDVVGPSAITVTMANTAGNASQSVTLQALNFGASTTAYTLQQFTGNTGTITLNGTIAPVLNVTAGSPHINVPIILGEDSTFTVASGSTLTFGTPGVISGGFGLTKNGPGTVVLGGLNTYTGATLINAGILQAGSTAAFGNGSAVTIDGGTLTLGAFNNTIGSLSGTSGSVNLGSAKLTISNGGGNTFSGIISDTSLGALTLSSGNLTLAGLNTYTGATTVNGGTLTAGISTSGPAGPFGNGSAVTVATGATLAFSTFDVAVGSLSNSGNVTSGGTISGSTFTQTSGGSLTLDITSLSNFGNIITTGALNLNGALTVTNTGGYSPNPGDQFILLQSSGAPTQIFGQFSSTVSPFPLGSFSYDYNANTVILQISGACGNGTWISTTTGSPWGNPGEWLPSCATAPGVSGGAPIGAVANFNDVAANAITVLMADSLGILPIDITLLDLHFNAPNTAYTINEYSGGGSITLAAPAGIHTPEIIVTAGTPTINVPVILDVDSIFSLSSGTLTLGSNGSVSSLSGVTLYISQGTNAGTLINNGNMAPTNIIIDGNTVTNNLTMYPAGTFTIAGLDNITNPVTLNNFAGIASGGLLTIGSADTNAAPVFVTNNGGDILGGSGLTILSGTVSNVSGGTMEAGNGQVLSIQGGTVSNDATSGFGSFGADLSFYGGSLTTSGAVVADTYTQTSLAHLTINVASATPGDFGSITATTANLGGTLDVNALSGFSLQNGQTIDLITSTNPISGTFSSISFTNFPNGVTPSYMYLTGALQLSVVVSQETLAASPPTLGGSQVTFVGVGQINSIIARNCFELRDRFSGWTERKEKQKKKKNTALASPDTTFDGNELNDEIVKAANNKAGNNIERAHVIAQRSAPVTKQKQGQLTQNVAEKKPIEKPWRVYAGPTAAFGDFKDQGNQKGFAFHSYGALAGFDYAFQSHNEDRGCDFGLGALADYAWSESGRLFTSNAVHGSIYATLVPKAVPELAFDGIAGFGYDWITLHRLTGTNNSQTATGKPHEIEYDFLFDIEYTFAHKSYAAMPDNFRVVPLVSIQYAHANVSSYTETGAGLNDLKVNSQHYESLTSILGSRFNYIFTTAKYSFSTELDAGWQREYLNRDKSVSFTAFNITNQATSATAHGPGRDSLLLDLDLLATFKDKYQIEANAGYQLNSEFYDVSFYLGFGIIF